ncbi:unnamed protein product [Chilo suppressalis]|uniref:Coatomer subunit epsilon n=1 Tax=Chilo suppressalis TaxID=168631 RepID=A0ABN8B0G5_CHISP|nr:unnamed protein product [Chilo suppressalis]
MHFMSASTPLLALQKDAYLYRSYIALGNYRLVLQELKTADPMLQPLKILVDYISPGANKPAIVADIDARSLELRAFTLQCLLAMNRPDLAKKQLKLLQDIEDDATLTQLAQAWLNLSQQKGSGHLGLDRPLWALLLPPVAVSVRREGGVIMCNIGGAGRGMDLPLWALLLPPVAVSVRREGGVIMCNIGGAGRGMDLPLWALLLPPVAVSVRREGGVIMCNIGGAGRGMDLPLWALLLPPVAVSVRREGGVIMCNIGGAGRGMDLPLWALLLPPVAVSVRREGGVIMCNIGGAGRGMDLPLWALLLPPVAVSVRREGGVIMCNIGGAGRGMDLPLWALLLPPVAEAEQMLSEAAARAPQQPDLLLGLAVTARHSGKPEVSITESHPEHQFTKEYGVKSSEFKRLVAQYQPSVAS